MSKKILPYKQIQKVWENIIKDGKEIDLELEIEIHKRLINLIHVGQFYYFILEVPISTFVFVSENIKEILGYTSEEFTLEFCIQHMHPDDFHKVLNFEQKIGEFFNELTLDNIFKYKVRYDFRIKNSHGDYVRILHQVVTIQTTEDGGVNKTLGIHTDISHIKTEGIPTLSFIGMEGEPSYINVAVEDRFEPSKELLSKREKEILFHIVDGKHSAEIATILFLSIHTIQNHRRNILAKTNTASTAELIVKSINEGWV